MAHDALSDLGACIRGLPKELPANNDALFNLLEILVDKIRFMRWVPARGRGGDHHQEWVRCKPASVTPSMLWL